jgi:hypothetical protein
MKKLLTISIVFILFSNWINAQDLMPNRTASVNHTRMATKHDLKHNALFKVNNDVLFPEDQPAWQKYQTDSVYMYYWDPAHTAWMSTVNYRTVYSYDGRLNLSGILTDNWDTTQNRFIHSYQYMYVYDHNNNVTEWIYNDWDTVTKSWIPYEHDSLIYLDNILISETWNYYNRVDHTWFKGDYFTYTDGGALTEECHLYWDANYLIFDGEMNKYTLNSKEKPVDYVVQVLDTAASAWANARRTESTYQDDTTLTGETLSAWDTSGNYWTPLQKNQYHYYSNNLLYEEIIQFWNYGGWYVALRYVYEYNDNSDILRIKLQNMYGSWVDSYQTLYTYNVNGKLTERLYQVRLDSGWVNLSQNKYSYDNNNNQTQYSIMQWDYTTHQVIYGYNYIYTYDSNNMRTLSVVQRWNTADNDWRNYYKRIYYNSLHISSVNDLRVEKLMSVYPNPSSDKITIELPSQENIRSCTITIYGIDGRLLMQQKSSGSRSVIDVRPLPVGLYFIRLDNITGISTGKFVKK